MTIFLTVLIALLIAAIAMDFATAEKNWTVKSSISTRSRIRSSSARGR